MAVKNFNTRIKLKYDLSSNWTSANTRLLAGEFGWAYDLNNFKIGDGNTGWGELKYAIPKVGSNIVASDNSDGVWEWSVPTATTDVLGVVKPDGSTITINNGVITASSASKVANALSIGSMTFDGSAAKSVTAGNGINLSATSASDTTTAISVVAKEGDYVKVTTTGVQLDDDRIDSDYNIDNGTDLATVASITAALDTLDVTVNGMGAGKTIATLTETDGKIAATFQDISILSSQISDKTNEYSVTGEVAVTGKSIAAALNTLDGSHNVATVSDYSAQEGEFATKKLEFFNATETDGKVSTNENAEETLYITKAVSANDPLIVKSDLSGIVGAMVYKGTVNSNSDLPITSTAGVQAGWTYIVATAGTYAEQACEVGDMIIVKEVTASEVKFNIVSGENQVTNYNETITAGASDATKIATVDGTDITVKTQVTAGSATIATVSDGVVTITPTVAQAANTGTIQAASGTSIVFNKLATTGAATDMTVTSAVYGTGDATDNAQTALTNLATAISNNVITIDGCKGAITTGNGLTDVTADNGSFGVKLDDTNAHGLSVGSDGIAMAIATGSQLGTVTVTASNGLTLTDGDIAYAHNTDDITVATKSGNAITINSILTPDASDAITVSETITLANVAATGTAADVAITDTGNLFEAENVEGALAEVVGKANNATIDDITGPWTTGNAITTVTGTSKSINVKLDDTKSHTATETSPATNAGSGLVITDNGLAINDDLEFIFDCGSATTNVE